MTPLFGCALFALALKRGKAEESLWSQAVKAANALQTSTCEQLAAKKAAAEASADSLDDLALVGGDSEARDAAVADLLRSVLGSQAADAVDIDELEFHVSALSLPPAWQPSRFSALTSSRHVFPLRRLTRFIR